MQIFCKQGKSSEEDIVAVQTCFVLDEGHLLY